MEKREKILVAFMAVAISYGGLEFFYFSRNTEPPAAHVEIDVEASRKMAQNLNVEIVKGETTPQQRYVLALATAKGRDNLFYQLPEGNPLSSAQATAEVADDTFEYTGFLEAGGRKMAIVNGVEYQVGEMLDHGGFILLDIAPDRVILGARQGSGTVLVPYRE